MTKTVNFSEHQISALQNICGVAAERFAEHVKTFEALAQTPTPPEGAMYPTGAAAQRLADQFKQQAEEAKAMQWLFADAKPFSVVTEDEDEG